MELLLQWHGNVEHLDRTPPAPPEPTPAAVADEISQPTHPKSMGSSEYRKARDPSICSEQNTKKTSNHWRDNIAIRNMRSPCPQMESNRRHRRNTGTQDTMKSAIRCKEPLKTNAPGRITNQRTYQESQNYQTAPSEFSAETKTHFEQ